MDSETINALYVCPVNPVTTIETIHELSSCSVSQSVSVLPVLVGESVYALFSCPVSVNESNFELSVCPVSVNESDFVLSSCPVPVKDLNFEFSAKLSSFDQGLYLWTVCPLSYHQG